MLALDARIDTPGWRAWRQILTGSRTGARVKEIRECSSIRTAT